MATLTVLYWRDIPAQVIVKDGRKSAKRQLSDRFQEAIDMAAMRSKAHEAGTYLEEWRRGLPETCEDELETVADTAARDLEATYNEARLAQLIKSGGASDETSIA